MKYTVLEMVQHVLSAMDSDEVNTIFDTVESQQVAKIVKECYNDILTIIDLPEIEQTFEFLPSGTVTLPTVMYRPDNVTDIRWVTYDCSEEAGETDHKQIHYMPFNEFFVWTNFKGGYDHTYNLSVDGDQLELRYRDDKWPEWFTVLKDKTVLFDSYHGDYDSTLQGDKTTGYGLVLPTFSMSDNWTPPLDPRMFSLLLNEAKAQAFAELKQTQNANAESKARRAMIRNQRRKDAFRRPYSYRNYAKRT